MGDRCVIVIMATVYDVFQQPYLLRRSLSLTVVQRSCSKSALCGRATLGYQVSATFVKMNFAARIRGSTSRGMGKAVVHSQ